MSRTRTRGFTIIELLVVMSIIALLVGLLLPAISSARGQAKMTASMTNLRNLATAHANYASEWNDRQFTLIDDNMARHGDNVPEAFDHYTDMHGGLLEGNSAMHPPATLGWGYAGGDGPYVLFAYRCDGNSINASMTVPINFGAGGTEYFGSFRLINVRQFNQYVSGRFYDPVFYAPKDTIVVAHVEGSSGYSCFDDPGEYCDQPSQQGFGDAPAWSSYVLSPAAMFNASVFQRPEPNGGGGWRDPWSIAAGMRSPSASQTQFAGLKTRMLEHHWLQSPKRQCNPYFEPGSYDGCEPPYFNQGTESSPITLFYDGHVESVGITRAQRADARQLEQTDGVYGLWSRDTGFGADGYLMSHSYDDASTSFHILTTDGIKGRDVIAD